MNSTRPIINSQHPNYIKQYYQASRKCNEYQHFAKFIKSMYPDHQKILDVGCGMGQTSIFFSRLGYNVTAMDTLKYNYLHLHNIPFIHQEFTMDTNIDNYDLICGFHCCKAVEIIIRNCITANKELAVTICEVNNSLDGTNFLNRKQYIEYLKGINANLKVAMLPIYNNCNNNYEGETIYYKKLINK